MKILILTQPLGCNYGGLLQNYALQTALMRLGHVVLTENRKEGSISYAKNHLYYFFRNIIRFNDKKYIVDRKSQYIIEQNTNKFVKKHIRITKPVKSSTKKKLLKENKFDAYVVGSDQIWRPRYSYHIYNYFLDFTAGLQVKRVAYAASFGVDSWEFSPEQTRKCKKLIEKFDAVSVREASGIKMCNDFLDRSDVQQVLDPVFLLNKNDYLNLIPKDKIIQGKEIFMHFLDSSETKYGTAKKIGEQLCCTGFSILPTKNYYDYGKNAINDCIFPPVEDFLRSIACARYVITDSFHAVAFSILFNKPFFVVANSTRGLTRIYSLLEMFGLQERFVHESSEVDINKLPLINFAVVEEKINLERNKSMDFLRNTLC